MSLASVSDSCLAILHATCYIELFFLLDVIEFDNGFSYIRSKKIWYGISVGSASLVSQTGSDLDKI